jgi:AcrR family transcriptional regulator
MSDITEKAIRDSFMKLIGERPLDKITVKDIVDDCGINRRTFYYHYSDIYALVEQILREETDAAISKYASPDAWQDGFISAARFALDNRRAVYHICNSVRREDLEQYVKRISRQVIETFVEKISKSPDAGDAVPEQDKRLITDFYCCALTGMVMDWIAGGMEGDTAAMIRRLGYLFDGSILRSLRRAAGQNDREGQDGKAGK